MLHHPTKYHTNALTHFLNLHTTAASTAAQTSSSASPPNDVVSVGAGANLINSNNLSSGGQTILSQQQQHCTAFSPTNGPTSIDFNATCGGGCVSPTGFDGKSFTIAAILGLNGANNNNSNRVRNFNEVVNLSLNQSHSKLLLGGFDRVPPHLYENGNGMPGMGKFNGGGGGGANFNPHHHHLSGHHHHPSSPASALQNLQQLHQQHINAATAGNFAASRDKYKNGKKIV